MRIIAGIYQLFMFITGIFCLLGKIAVYIWIGIFMLIIGAIGFITAFYGTVIFGAIILEMFKLFA